MPALHNTRGNNEATLFHDLLTHVCATELTVDLSYWFWWKHSVFFIFVVVWMVKDHMLSFLESFYSLTMAAISPLSLLGQKRLSFNKLLAVWDVHSSALASSCSDMGSDLIWHHRQLQQRGRLPEGEREETVWWTEDDSDRHRDKQRDVLKPSCSLSIYCSPCTRTMNTYLCSACVHVVASLIQILHHLSVSQRALSTVWTH